jgi:hypothetical protein
MTTLCGLMYQITNLESKSEEWLSKPENRQKSALLKNKNVVKDLCDFLIKSKWITDKIEHVVDTVTCREAYRRAKNFADNYNLIARKVDDAFKIIIDSENGNCRQLTIYKQ